MCVDDLFGCAGTAGLGDLDLGGMDFSVSSCWSDCYVLYYPISRSNHCFILQKFGGMGGMGDMGMGMGMGDMGDMGDDNDSDESDDDGKFLSCMSNAEWYIVHNFFSIVSEVVEPCDASV